MSQAQALEIYRLAIRLMAEQPSGSSFLVKAFSNTDELIGATPYTTFAQALAQAENDRTADYYLAELWQSMPDGSLLNTLLYTMLPYDGKLQAVNFDMDDDMLPFDPLPETEDIHVTTASWFVLR